LLKNFILTVKEENFLIFQQKNEQEAFETDTLKKQLYECDYVGNQGKTVDRKVQ